jgi:hypothetical protein
VELASVAHTAETLHVAAGTDSCVLHEHKKLASLKRIHCVSGAYTLLLVTTSIASQGDCSARHWQQQLLLTMWTQKWLCKRRV